MDRNLAGYYRKVFGMTHYHHYAISELEALPIFEFDIYYDLVTEAIQKQKEEKIGASATMGTH
jgi:hypothetical protein